MVISRYVPISPQAATTSGRCNRLPVWIRAAPGLLVLSALLVFTSSCSDDDDGGNNTSNEDAGTQPDAAPDAGQPSPCDLLHDDLQAAVEQAAAAPSVPGVILGVSTPDCPDFLGAGGLAFVDPQAPMSTAHQHWLGSITKTYVASVVMRLVEEDVLSLDATLMNWNDQFAGASEITLRQLLNHTSGIPDYTEDASFLDAVLSDMGHVWTPEEVYPYALGIPPAFGPGQGWSYSNTAYLLLGQIIAEETGGTLGAAFEQYLLTPLGLENTFYDCESAPTGEMCGHYFQGQDVIGTLDPSWAGAAGAMASDARDQLAWCRALFGGELFDADFLDQMLDAATTPSPSIGYGLGITIRYSTAAGEAWGHDGRGPGVASELWYFPAEDVCVSVHMNLSPPQANVVVPSATLAFDEVLPLLMQER